MIHNFCRWICVMVMKAFFRMEVCGTPQIPARGGFILAANHVSYLDPVAIGSACRRQLYYMAKEELFRKPFFNWFLRKVHAFPVKRHTADLGALKEALRRVKSGAGLLLFPEGSRAAEGQVQEPLGGVGFLAAKAGVPVIPVLVRGTDRALPANEKKVRFTKIAVYFGQPVSIDGKLPYHDIARSIMDQVRQLSCVVGK